MSINKITRTAKNIAKGVGNVNKTVGSVRKANSANKALWAAHDDAMKNYRKQEENALKRYNEAKKKRR